MAVDVYKVSTWQMLKIICKNCGFRYAVSFVFIRLWSKLSAFMANLLVRLKNMLKINLD